MRTLITTLAAAVLLAAPISVNAQDLPSYATQSGDTQIRGRVLSFDGGYTVDVRDERGYIDHVRLHRGTIINPTGLTLSSGMIVSILGYNAGTYFAANEVDTPYTFDYGIPYYGGRPWDYYGPRYTIGFFFGNPGWWHGPSFYGSYHYAGGARIYDNVRVHDVYHGGTFRGRDYVAPRSAGGYDPHAQSAHGDDRHGHR
jgi:hypothetical protein